MAIKKAYQDIVSLLEANLEVPVSEVIERVKELSESKRASGGGGSRHMKDTEGTVVAVFDYYFKKWMPLVGAEAVDFGTKASAATGFNSMCKAGVSHWTKQQAAAKKATTQIIDDLESGELDVADIEARRAQIEATRTAIEPVEYGFNEKDQCVAYLSDSGHEVSAN